MSELPFDRTPTSVRTRAALFAMWSLAAAFLVARHVVWRDEVRALTLALRGEDVLAMLRGVQGEGHPALWYLMLRAAHAIVAVPQVLPAVGALVGYAAAALFAFRAPFRAAVLALVLASGFVLVEYTAIARNYGIAMLLMFALAAVPRGRGWIEGVLLAALANTSVPAVIAAGAWMVFRIIETGSEAGWRPSAAWRPILIAGTLAVIGVLLCFVTVYPPVNDAAMPRGGVDAGLIADAVIGVAYRLHTLMPEGMVGVPGAAMALTLLLFASPLALIRSPAGCVAALLALVGMALCCALLYPGSYRHHALYLAFLVTLLWAVADGRGGRWSQSSSELARPAGWAVVALLALQAPVSAVALIRAAQGKVYSHSRDLAAILDRPENRRAIVIALPDMLAEPLPYYGDHLAWLSHERRFGRTVRYTRDVMVDLSLDRVFADARQLRAITGRPVVLAIQSDLDPHVPHQETDGYITTFSTTPAAVRAFEAATVRVARFDDAETDENFTVYRLR